MKGKELKIRLVAFKQYNVSGLYSYKLTTCVLKYKKGLSLKERMNLPRQFQITIYSVPKTIIAQHAHVNYHGFCAYFHGN